MNLVSSGFRSSRLTVVVQVVQTIQQCSTAPPQYDTTSLGPGNPRNPNAKAVNGGRVPLLLGAVSHLTIAK